MSAAYEVQERAARLDIPGYGRDEIAFITETLEIVKPEAIFEWGTSYGASARIFHEACGILGLACQVHSTDLPISLAAISPEHAGTNTGVIFSGIQDITQHWGDGVTESLVAFRQGNSPRSLFFVDGDHSEENVLRELRWLYAVAPSSALLLHDTNPGARPNFGPHHALVRFLEGDVSYQVTMLNSAAGMARLLP